MMTQPWTHNTVFDPARPIFVVSDLHLGDGSSAFVRQGKETLLHRFLDHVDREGGQLVVLGDLLELWRFSLEAVVERWAGLLDRLQQLQAVYIPGNHDDLVAEPWTQQVHSFFTHVQAPFALTIGDQRIQFMHGHEIDPFIKGAFHENALYMKCFHALFDLRDRVHWIGHEALADVGLGLSEMCLSVRQWLSRVSDQVWHPDLKAQWTSAVRPALRHMRTHRMLSRYLYHRDEVAYDVAIVGHTHREGQFGAWYYNSGCWVKPSNNFLKIHPDAHVEVYNWADYQAHLNATILGTS